MRFDRIPAVLSAAVLLGCHALGHRGAVAESAGPGGHFPLVDGPTQAVIVGDDTIRPLPQLKHQTGPPHLLQHYIHQSTGRKLNVISEDQYDPATMPHAVFVGSTRRAEEQFGQRLSGMDADGYIVHVAADQVVLAGASEHSAAWAQFDFLREYLGIDTYLPSRIGTVVPRHKRVLVPVETRIEIPVFRSRAFSALNTNNGLRSQPDIPWRTYRRYAFHHHIHTFITVEEFGQTHPEYFPERDGKRLIVSTAAGPSPCISNPEVVQIIIDKCRHFFDQNPGELTVSLGMTDGGWCECSKCRALDGPSIDVAGDTSPKSRRYYTFLNQVARALQESHPGKSIGVLGYAGAEYPPADLEVERNIIPYLCYTRANWYNDEVKQADLVSTDAWARRVDQIGIYEYLYGSGFSIPRIYHHDLADLLRHVADLGGGGFYAEIYSNHGLDGPKAWVTEKLLWDPYQDVDELVRRWCVALFEQAAPAMERYFNRLERIRIRNGPRGGIPHGKFYFYRKDHQLELFRPQDMDLLKQDLETARRLANSDPVRQRLEYFASTIKITDLAVRRYHAYKEAKQLAERRAEAPRVLAALIEGDRNAPTEDLEAYTEKIKTEDPTRFLGGVEISLATQIAQQVLGDLAWSRVHERLGGGERGPDRLVAAAKARIDAALPAGAAGDPIAAARVRWMHRGAERVALAHRVDTPPTIDGQPREDSWRWVDHDPWFEWKSGRSVRTGTRFALSYDSEYLYVALKCPQDDLRSIERCEAYGAPAWKHASVEIFLNPDERDAPPDQVAVFQTIPAYGGGLWERAQHATERYAVTDNGKDIYQIELALSFAKLRMSPDRFPYLRLNFVRNLKKGGHSSVAWFPSSAGHASPQARGWLVFE